MAQWKSKKRRHKNRLEEEKQEDGFRVRKKCSKEEKGREISNRSADHNKQPWYRVASN